jgi:VanZ family protein
MASTTLLFPNSLQPAPPRWLAILQAWLPVVLFTSIFAIESTAAFGANHTSAPLHGFLHRLFGSVVNFDWPLLHHLIRKTGHFTGYGLFSLVCYRGLRLTLGQGRALLSPRRVSHAIAIAATFLVASADEIHQTFLPNRTGCFSDVLLDTSGALALQLALLFTLRILERRSTHAAQGEGPARRTIRLAA